MTSRLLGALVGGDFLRQKSQEVADQYRKLEDQVPDVILASLRARFPDADPRILAERHSGIVYATEKDLRGYYASSSLRRRAALSRLLEVSNCEIS